MMMIVIIKFNMVYLGLLELVQKSKQVDQNPELVIRNTMSTSRH